MPRLNERLAQPTGPCAVVAELVDHRGSVPAAVAAIERAARAGADGVAFVSYRAATLARRCVAPESAVDHERRLARAEVPLEAHGRLRDEARRHGLACVIVPRDATRTALVASLAVPALGVWPEDVTETALLERLGACGRLVMLAVEGVDDRGVGAALDAIGRGAGPAVRRPPIVVLAGGSLSQLDRWVQRASHPVGWRSATGDPALAIAAVARGARAVVHPLVADDAVTNDHDAFGALVRGIRDVERALDGGEGVPVAMGQARPWGTRRAVMGRRG